MSLNERKDPLPPDNEIDLPEPPPHDPIELDPMNPTAPPPNTEPTTSERPDLDWSEHED